MIANYLAGDVVALRAVRIEDKDHAVAWFEGAYPVNSDRAEKYLRDELDGFSTHKLFLIIVRVANDEIVGGVRLRLHPRHSDIFIRVAPTLEDADEIQGEALKTLVPWLRDEGQHITVTADIPADRPHAIAAAEQVGMEQTGRLREWYVRPGGRADRLIFQAVHPRWRERDGSDA